MELKMENKTMEHLKMHSLNKIDENIAKIAQLFPNCVTEAKGENGEITKKIDFDMLKQELSYSLVEGREERYQFTWSDKKQAILTANAPINKTLRPCREESVNFDKTENLYIEGDNLEVLKLLQETYLGKIKMIYIDPPYNTGNDFVYNDDFRTKNLEFREKSGNFDEEGKQLVDNYTRNTESNGRFHTDWLNMMYPRLKLARDLLSDDGVIFISIDDNEVDNLRKICDEIFGECNFVAQLTTVMNLKGNNDEFGFAGTHEYSLVYMKYKDSVFDLNGVPLTEEDKTEYTLSDEKGKFKKGATLMRTGEAGAREKRPKGYYPIYVSKDLKSLNITRQASDDYEVYPKTVDGKEMSWRRSPEFLLKTKDEFIITKTNNGISFNKKQRLEDDIRRGKKAKTLFYKPEYSSGNGTSLIKELFNGRLFDNPKPLTLIKDMLSIGSSNNVDMDDDTSLISSEESPIILDFFSGSATTAHAVMQLNAEDGGNRKFIMVQLPEPCDEKSEAFKAGYKNICEIGKERIRRAGRKIAETTIQTGGGMKNSLFENSLTTSAKTPLGVSNPCDNIGGVAGVSPAEGVAENAQAVGARGRLPPSDIKLDIGFRVLKCDTSNMEDVYYSPDHLDKQDLFKNNIKSDRTAEDLLFQVMLDLGIMLSSKIQTKQIDGKTVYYVEGNYLMACFDDTVDEATITEIAKGKPYYFVMRDPANSKDGDSLITNFEQIFTTYSPDTVRKIL